MKVLLAILLIFTVSCSSKRKSYKDAYVFPVWYQTPPASSDRFFYGTGKAVGQTSAVNDALKNIAGQVSSVVSSQYKEELKATNQRVDNQVEETIKVEISQIELSGYKILQSQQMENFDFLVLVQIEKSVIVNHYLNKMNKLQYSINQKLLLSDYQFLKNKMPLQQELNDLERVLSILGSLQAPRVAETEELRRFQDSFHQRNEQISFAIVSKNQQFFKNENTLKDAVTHYGHKVSPDGSLVILLEGISVQKREGGLYLVRQQIEIKIMDKEGKILTSRMVEEVGASNLSFDDAVSNTGHALKEQFKKKGFQSFFGLN